MKNPFGERFVVKVTLKLFINPIFFSNFRMILPKCYISAGKEIIIDAQYIYQGPGCSMHGNELVDITADQTLNEGSITAGDLLPNKEDEWKTSADIDKDKFVPTIPDHNNDSTISSSSESIYTINTFTCLLIMTFFHCFFKKLG